jgi:hypothetical protein
MGACHVVTETREATCPLHPSDPPTSRKGARCASYSSTVVSTERGAGTRWSRSSSGSGTRCSRSTFPARARGWRRRRPTPPGGLPSARWWKVVTCWSGTPRADSPSRSRPMSSPRRSAGWCTSRPRYRSRARRWVPPPRAVLNVGPQRSDCPWRTSVPGRRSRTGTVRLDHQSRSGQQALLSRLRSGRPGLGLFPSHSPAARPDP